MASSSTTRCGRASTDVWAIGEVALHDGLIYGLVAPGYEMAAVVADRGSLGGDGRYRGQRPVDQAQAARRRRRELRAEQRRRATASTSSSTTTRSTRSSAGSPSTPPPERCVGGALRRRHLRATSCSTAITLGLATQPDDLPAYLLPASVRPPDQGALPDARAALQLQRGQRRNDPAAVGRRVLRRSATSRRATCAGTSCGGCVPAVSLAHPHRARRARRRRVERALRALRPVPPRALRPRPLPSATDRGPSVLAGPRTRPGLRDLPARRSRRSSRRSSGGYVLGGDQAALQDTNDLHLANMQRNGTYSVVPRVPGGEITPDQLIALGTIAKDFGLYTKITGGQRIDLLGARLQRPPRDLAPGDRRRHGVGTGLRQVAAHREVVRRLDLVPVRRAGLGRAWRSVSRSATAGLRSPHKIKMGVSGCTRECAEAQSKDVGVIATENGWNLYVGGNGGRSPRHADLLADRPDRRASWSRAIDRFLMFYIRTADRLQRTSTVARERSMVVSTTCGASSSTTRWASAPRLDADMAAARRRVRVRVEGDARRSRSGSPTSSSSSTRPTSHSTPVWITERGQRVPA